jgi:O-antigen ligase
MMNVFEIPKQEVFFVLVFLSFISFLITFFIRKKFEWPFSFAYPAIALALVLSGFFSYFFSLHPELSFFGNYGRRQGFIQLIFYVVFFLLLLMFLQNKNKASKLVWTTVLSSVIPVFYGLAQFFRLDPLHWAENMGRVFSTMGQPNFFGHYLILIIPLTVLATIFLTRRFWPRFFLSSLFIFQSICLYSTFSRAAWVALAGEIFFLTVFFLWLKKGKRFLFLSLLAVLFVFAGIVWLVGNPPGKMSINNSFFSRIESIFDANSASNRARLNYWSAAMAAFSEAPLRTKIFGYGPDVLSDVFASRYQSEWALVERIYSWPDRAHNFILDSLLHFGLFGLWVSILAVIYFLKEIIYFFRHSARDSYYYFVVFCLTALFGYFINNLFSFSLTILNVFFVVILSSAIAIIAKREERIISLPLSFFSRLALLLVAFVLGIIFIFIRSVKVMEADHQYLLAKKAVSSGECQPLSSLKQAFILNTRENAYREEYLHQGLLCLKNISAEEEKNALESSLFEVFRQIPEKERNSFALLDEVNLLSVVALSDKKFASMAEKKFQDFLKVYPHLGQIYINWADYKIQAGDSEGAINIILEGLEKAFPKNWDDEKIFSERRQDIAREIIYFYELLGNSYQATGQLDKALDYYSRIIKLNPLYLPIYKKIADVYYLKKDYNMALWYNKRGYSLNPSDYVWPLAIGLVYQEKGDQEAARVYLEESLNLAPEDKRGEIENIIASLNNTGKKNNE